MIIMIKKIILLVCLLALIFSSSINASEITGRISTNMDSIDYEDSSESDVEDVEEDENKDIYEDENNIEEIIENNETGGGFVIFNNLIEKNKKDTTVQVKDDDSEEVKTLGVFKVHFDNGMLIRGSDMRIYIIEDQAKRYIPSLKDLLKYKGQEIFNVDDRAIRQYRDIYKKYLDGQLIREFGEEKVYVIKGGKKIHIISIEELWENYTGEEIFNVSREELLKYLVMATLISGRGGGLKP